MIGLLGRWSLKNIENPNLLLVSIVSRLGERLLNPWGYEVGYWFKTIIFKSKDINALRSRVTPAANTKIASAPLHVPAFERSGGMIRNRIDGVIDSTTGGLSASLHVPTFERSGGMIRNRVDGMLDPTTGNGAGLS